LSAAEPAPHQAEVRDDDEESEALVARLTPSPPADSQRNLVWEAAWKGKR
jgi:hypothetical protein